MAKARTKPLRFTHLKLTNWRNFRSVDMALGERAFFIGPNASGKSNLLDAFRFLADIARPGSGGLGAAIRNRGGFSAVRCLYARNPSHVEIEVELGTTASPNMWGYDLKINIKKNEQFVSIISETITQNGNVIKKRERHDSDDALEYSQTLLEQVNANKDFRDLVDFLTSCRYLHLVPQIVRDRTRGRVDGEDVFGSDLLRRIKDMPRKTRDPRLRRISDALRIAVPQFHEIQLEDDASGVPHLYASFLHGHHRATKQSEAHFSDGTLRLIGLLWSIAEKGGPLFLEEPELSLNDAVISQLPRMFETMYKLSGRQIIASTHSISLLDDMGIALPEVHRIMVDTNGSQVETVIDNAVIKAQVESGMTIGQAVMPLLAPQGVENLGLLHVAG